MPELPDVEAYLACLRTRVVGMPIRAVQIIGPSVLRTVTPDVDALVDHAVTAVRRLGKRIVLALDGDLHVVIHLMIAGRLRWLEVTAKLPGRITQAAFDFPNGRLALTEAGTQRRATLHVVQDEAALAAHNPGGLEPLEIDLPTFAAALRRENHTLKRVLTDPRVIAGIGNAYSDEILHAARLSPVRLSQKLSDEEVSRLHAATRQVLQTWTRRLIAKFARKFPGPGEITAFRDDFAVHGRFNEPCPVCGEPVQRIRYADNETNYCARCQNDGRLLADRSLSRLLKNDWPKSIDEL